MEVNILADNIVFEKLRYENGTTVTVGEYTERLDLDNGPNFLISLNFESGLQMPNNYCWCSLDRKFYHHVRQTKTIKDADGRSLYIRFWVRMMDIV